MYEKLSTINNVYLMQCLMSKKDEGFIARDPFYQRYLDDDSSIGPLDEDCGRKEKRKIGNINGALILVSHFLRQLPFSCVPPKFTSGISVAGNGVVALSIAPTSITMKLSADLNLPHKLALCLPSSSFSPGHGDFYVSGGRTSGLCSNRTSRSRSSSILSADRPFMAPYLRPTSIDKNGRGGTKISTLTPYTVLHSAIYSALVAEFLKQAAEKKMRRVDLITPFGACFDARSIRSGVAGPDVPAMALVLPSDAQWGIEGVNSMVRVSEEVMRPGFVDGGSTPITALVIGAHQMEDNLVEFDVAVMAFRFSNSLLLRNTGCSHS
ncbi:probable aspartic proteinase GIP2 [Eucalyptus grandis]|uniref:probable aspartic proteinase GIP2 n=1 Tax=Eucalyptus grandis TaxID=71139 RepID=UPI00192ED05E|nr:probable aspartic proteinase GIP2 [Eucalyptus grandis]